MLTIFILWMLMTFSLNTVLVSGHTHTMGPSSLAVPKRQTITQTNSSCATVCGEFLALKAQCNTPQCGCTIHFVSAQGECFLCVSNTAQEAADIQLFLDEEMYQCHAEGISLEFRLFLSPEATAILDENKRKSEILRQQQTAFLVLQVLGGHVGLVITLFFTAFSPKCHRNPGFFNFCITWIFSSVIYCLMLYRGTYGHTIINPLGSVPEVECLAQAALTSGAQVMTACSTMLLVLQLWLCLRASLYRGSTNEVEKRELSLNIFMVSPPYILFAICALAAFLIGKQRIAAPAGLTTSRIAVTNFYCMIYHQDFVRLIYGMTLFFLIATIILDVLIGHIIYSHWKIFRSIQNKNVVSLSLVLRLIIFSMYRIVDAIACAAALRNSIRVVEGSMSDSGSLKFTFSTWIDILQASVPLLGFLTLGITKEMISALTFWRKTRGSIYNLKEHDRSNNDVTIA